MRLASPRPARANLAWLSFLGSIALFAGLTVLLCLDRIAAWFAPRPKTTLVVFCAAGLRAPVEAVAREYQGQFGVEVQLQYGGSNTLLANLKVAPRADLYIPADDSYVRLAQDQSLIDEVLPLATQRPVLAVTKGNPGKVKSLEDVIARRLRVAQANPEAAAVGLLARDALKRSRQWAAFEKCVVVTKPTVMDVAADVQVGAVEAGVVWDVTANQVPGLETVPAPAFKGVEATLSACVARKCEQPAAALHFARYLAASDRGLKAFAAQGFAPVEGDAWSDEPELTLYVGAMLKPAVDRTIAAFEEREGVHITRVYNGCGILVGQMGIKRPDAFFACDKDFFDVDVDKARRLKVKDLFGPPITVSSNQLVILVHKGNPHNIRRLRDLAKPGLRVGVGHEKQCAMGVVTQKALKQDRTDAAVMRNVTVQSPTGDMLVNQMRTKSLDAAIAYISNAAGAADLLEAVPIDIPCAVVDQPYAVGKDTRHKHLAERLLAAIRRAESRQLFKDNGFTWKAEDTKR